MSEGCLPEWEPFGQETLGEPEVTISLGETSDDPDTAPVSEAEFRFFIQGSRPLSGPPGLRDRSSAAGKRQHEKGSDLPAGFRLGALLYQRRSLNLHASSVQIGDGAVVFCGRRGEGRSTIAALPGKLGCK